MSGEPSHDHAATRPIITKLVLENFKSYAGVVEIGPFHKCFSSIVGPNGSGKSNVIDALLFVFGKRAKQIRLNKVSELIHHSDNHRHLESARVSVHFIDIIDLEGDACDIVPGTEIVISRVAFRNNQSKYYLNNRTSSFTEVTTLLNTKGIDLHNNRFLILQGEVEQIAMMKPKAPNPHEDGLLEYLEDIIGTNKYVESIEEAARRVEEANELRQEKINRVKSVEKEKDALEGAKAEAEEYIQKERELMRVRAVQYRLFIDECKTNIERITGKRQELEEKLTHERTKLTDNQEALDAMELQYNQIVKEYETLSTALAEIKAEFAVFERKDIKLREDVKHNKLMIKKLTQKIAHETENAQNQDAAVTNHLAHIPELEKRIEQLTGELQKEESALDAIYVSLKGETERLRVKLEEKQAKLAVENQRVNDMRSQVDIKTSELELLQNKATTMRAHLEEAQKTLLDTQTTIATREEDMIRLAQNKETNTKRAHNIQVELTSLANEESRITNDLRTLRAKLEESKTAQQAARSRGKVLEGLMEAKARGEIRGIHGRLGDLGTIDREYDVAISTACGALDNIVVDDAETGQHCVEFLRRNQLGRTTFILLDKVAHLKAQMYATTTRTPEGVKRLFDLVAVKNKIYLPAFYKALGDTIVATELEQASRIAYGAKRWRVVTLQGQLIDTSGTMTGGGHAVARGGMSSTLVEPVSQDEMGEMERQVNELTNMARDVAMKRASLETERDRMLSSLSEISVVISKAEMEVEALKGQIPDIQDRIKSLRQHQGVSVEDKTRIAELTKQVDKERNALNKAKSEASTLEADVKAVQEAILNVGGDRLRAQKSKVESLSREGDETNKCITKHRVQAQTAEKNAGKARKAVVTAEKDLERARTNITKEKEDLKQLEDDALAVQASVKEKQAILDAKAQAVDAIKTEHEKVKKIVDTVRSVELDISSQVEDYVRSIHDNEEKEKHWNKKLSDVRRQWEKDVASDGEEDNGEPQTLPELSDEELAQQSRDDVQYTITMLEETLGHMKPNMSAICEYRKKERDYRSRVQELDIATEERDAARREHDALRSRRLTEFMEGFSIITVKLKEMYQMITLGGDAELELVDSLDPFSEGIVFSVRPPSKSWKNIQNLSGGEKTLSSLALVFALHHYKPTPLYCMDEIDAALDFRNVSIIANYIKERTKNAQFVVISLRNHMFELADRLVGIYKTDNCTKSVTLDPKNLVIPPPIVEAAR